MSSAGRSESRNTTPSADTAARVVLRAVTPDDFLVLYEYQRDPESCRMAVATPREREAFWSHWTKILADSAVMLRAIVVDGRVVGNGV